MKCVVFGTSDDGLGTVLSSSTPKRVEVHDPRTPGHQTSIAWASRALGNQTDDLTSEIEHIDLALAPGEVRFLRSVRPAGDVSAMHRTPHTVEYIVVVTGATTVEMEDGSAVILEQGDMAVQLSAFHRWRNHTTEPCVLAVVILGIDSDAPDAPERMILE